MNKKNIHRNSILIVLLFLVLAACGQIDGWKTAQIGKYGSIQVPESWKISTADEFIYFSLEENGGSKDVLVQFRSDENINEYFAEIEELVWLRDENFSNSAGIMKQKAYYQDGSSAEIFALHFTGPNAYESTEFLCVDGSVSEDTLKKIAKSFIMSE